MAKRKGGFGSKQSHIPPDGHLRVSQAVSTFGPGAMVDLIDNAVLISGLNFWRFGGSKGVRTLHDPRLRELLADDLQVRGVVLSQEGPFREPPWNEDRDRSPERGIPVFEFPRWFVCQNPDCRALTQGSALELKKPRYHHACDGGDKKNKTTACVPVRFVVACPRGHLDDFPWIFFVHKEGRCGAPKLRLNEGRAGDFGEISISCACGARRSLNEAKGGLPPCRGKRPWLGREGDEPCEEAQRLLVRTATNSYFAQTVSALSIPDRQTELRDRVSKVWDVLGTADAATLPVYRQIPKVKHALEGESDADVLAAVQVIRSKQSPQRMPPRTAEFTQIIGAPREQPGELPEPEDDFFARALPPTKLPPGIAKIVLLPKLRELRVQVGLTRIESAAANLQGEYDLGVKVAGLGLNTDWLPANEVRGEGLFLQLDERAVRVWEGRSAVVKRGKELSDGFEQWKARPPGSKAEFLGLRFYLMHSLSHLLITALSLECGYAASAIRERLYCSEPDEEPMAGILLSTGTPGAEGTLGGLVEQGRRLSRHLERAKDMGRLCSNDPVCASHSPRNDPGERFLEGAACHGCLFIAEPSCERNNRFLDRALVVPTLGQEDTAFFFEG